MIETLILLLIKLVLLAVAVYLVIWVLEQIGFSIPERIKNLLWVVVVLIALLFVVRAFNLTSMF